MAEIDDSVAMSIVTLAELQAGAANDELRTALLARLRQSIPALPFTEAEAEAYGRIVERHGHDRRKVLDRMIAAQAMVAGCRLITINGRDFRGIEGLELEVWPAPA
jgi:tRNA(fMet)-specific endonuclease VapC